MGIRTPGGISATHPFQGCTLNHSDIFPKKKSAKKQTRETDRVRTCDLHLRRVALYPAELQSRKTLRLGKRKRQESNLPSPNGTDGLAIRCITALPRFQNQRSERDLNPRNPQRFNGFQDRRVRPLCHRSKIVLK